MSTFILTWNASDAAYDPAEYRRHQRATQRGQKPNNSWSFGSRRTGVTRGDRLFLLRQQHDRGIVASGLVTRSEPTWERHWAHPRRGNPIPYWPLKWDVVLPVEDRLPIEVLLQELPLVHNWNNTFSSGQMIQARDGQSTTARLEHDLEELWHDHLLALGRATAQQPPSVSFVPFDGSEPDHDGSNTVGVEDHLTPSFEVAEVLRHSAMRREADLVQRLREHLEGLQHEVKRHDIRFPGQRAPLFTDLEDFTTQTLYEAKGEVTREAVRMAIGQLLDYRRHIQPHPRHLVVLLPGDPGDDLRDLMSSVKIECIYPNAAGGFDGIEP